MGDRVPHVPHAPSGELRDFFEVLYRGLRLITGYLEKRYGFARKNEGNGE